MKRKLVFTLAIGVVLVLQSVAAQAISLSFDPVAQSVTNGSQAVVNLNISGLGSGAAPSLGTFDLDIGFDASVLAFNSATFGTGLDLFGSGDNVTSITDLGSVVELFEMSMDSVSDLNTLQGDSFTLATLTFDTVGLGSSLLNLSNVTLGDAAGGGLTVTLGTGSIEVTAAAVPEPTTLLLFGTGILGLLGYAARKRRWQAKQGIPQPTL